jgi:hypothetical protein
MKGKDSAGVFILSIGIPLLVTGSSFHFRPTLDSFGAHDDSFRAVLVACCTCRIRLREYNRRVYCRLAGVPYLRDRERDRLLNVGIDVGEPGRANEPPPWIEEGMNPKIVGNSYKIESPKISAASALDASSACLQCGEAQREYLCVPCGHFCVRLLLCSDTVSSCLSESHNVGSPFCVVM